MVKVVVSAAAKSPLARDLPVTLDIPGKDASTATVADVKAAFASKYPKFYVSRQKLSLKGDKKALSDEATLASLGVEDGGEVAVKDLGAQISWKTVFVIEYIGPLIIHPLIYHFPKVFYGGPVRHSTLQKYVYAMVMLHFLKREYESVFVHRYSHGTMPFAYVFRNSAHYHILGGLALAYSVYSPTFSSASPWIRGTIRENPQFLWGCIAVWLYSEISNLKTHLTLRNLRPAGSKQRGIPTGYGFNLVTCPNYFFESVGWLTISVMTGSYASWFFFCAGTYTMAMWALKKHKNYKKEFGTAYPERKIMFPFIW